jgi:type II secretory pathway component PulF
MANFTYQARNAAGQSIGGDTEAADQQAAAMALMERGLMVISLRP